MKQDNLFIKEPRQRAWACVSMIFGSLAVLMLIYILAQPVKETPPASEKTVAIKWLHGMQYEALEVDSAITYHYEGYDDHYVYIDGRCELFCHSEFMWRDFTVTYMPASQYKPKNQH